MSWTDFDELTAILSDVAVQKAEPTNPALDEVIAILEGEISNYAGEEKRLKMSKFRAKYNQNKGASFALGFALEQAKRIRAKSEVIE